MTIQHLRPAATPSTLCFAVFRFAVVGGALLLLHGASQPASAQRTRAPTNSRGHANENALTDWSREHMKEQINRLFEQQRISLMPQIKEDFARIQVVNNALMRAIFGRHTVDYKNILETTAEIRKRAARLKINLMLPAPEGAERARPRPASSAEKALEESLRMLDSSVMSFVHNPLFQKTEVLDAKLSTNASRDLKSIIEMCGVIRKSVEQLHKTSALNRVLAGPPH